LKGREPIAQLAKVNPSVLPPREKGEGEVLGLLKNPLYGLPEETEFEISDYKPKLKLDYVSQPQLAIGVDRYGTFAGGGLAFYFSDMLGYHNLVGMFQLSSRLQDSAALVGYQSSKRRLNWGAVAQRIPYVTGGFAAGFDDPFNPTAYIEQEFIFRQINYQLAGFAAYPFNQVRRFELTAGYSLIDFNQEVRTRTFSLDGFELSREKEKLPAPDSLQFGFGAAALVYDSSFFGATGPILGQSYRLEVSPYMGTIDFHTILADYRRYFMPVRPFTLAFRFLHFGRYGRGGEDTRLFPLFIGYETLVRGYDTGSFTVDEVTGTDPFDFGSLFGSKMMVANVELRFPLFQVLGIGRGYYGVFPIDFIAFYDAGVAWWDDNDLYDEFGALVETDRKAFDRPKPKKGWHFQFTFTPGF
jgi:outer membrane protein assembly factor BamA